MLILKSFLRASFTPFTNLRKVFNFTVMVLYSFRGKLYRYLIYDWHDSLSDTVEVTAIAFWAEKTRREIITTSTGSIRIFFMFVIVSLLLVKQLSHAYISVSFMNKSVSIIDQSLS